MIKNITHKILARFLKENSLYFKGKYLIEKPNNLYCFNRALVFDKINYCNIFTDFLTNTIYKPLFIDFLNKKKIKDKFIQNFISYHNKEMYKFNDIFTMYYPTNYIRYAFMWDETEEGHMFWQEIHIKWSNLFNKILHTYI